MIYTAEDPGNWAIWKTKLKNKNLSLQEATQKYRKEKLLFESQYMDFVQQQQAILSQKAQTGGTSLNGVVSAAFDAAPVFQTNTANTQTLKVKFSKPVTVTGQPQVSVANNQFGGGQAAAFPYTFTAGSGTTDLTFTHVHPSQNVTLQGFSSNVCAGPDLVAAGGTRTSPVSASNGDYAFPANTNYTTSGDGSNIALQVRITDGAFAIVTVTTVGDNFIPNEVITFANGSLGASSIGGSITVPITTLRADTASFPVGSAVTLNGGAITTGDGTFNTQYNDIARRQGTPALGFSSNSTKTGLAT